MKTISDVYPVAIVMDRYTGIYAGGAWVAVANADLLVDGRPRVDFVLSDDGKTPHADDVSAMEYWSAPDEWIATGNSPDKALENLLKGVRPSFLGGSDRQI